MILPGFLGLGGKYLDDSQNDWKDVVSLHSLSEVNPLDFWSSHSLAPLQNGLQRMGKWVNEQKKDCRFFIGYSFGGRVGLHALIEDLNTSNWDAAILISTHPGLKTQKEKELRIISDQVWSEKFLKNPWDSLIQEWNSQAVLKHSSSPYILEKFYSRKRLAESFLSCSLGKQKNLISDLVKIKIPVLWISGELDVKFCNIQEDVIKLNPLFKGKIILDAGHRVHIDQPVRLKNKIKGFLESVGLNE